ncbi:hypothetical protein LPJ71_009343, partial [Coemansia sp. S17]
EAGKLLLERYDDYATRARIMTGVHAKPKGETSGGAENRDPAVGAAVKEKKKNLKRF